MPSPPALLRRAALLALALLAPPAWVPAADRPPGPLSPADERATFRLADPGLTIELVAAEPDVVSPVAVAWDEHGRMFVAEMTDYPAGPASGRVRLLEDRDGDGRCEHAMVFAEGLAFPSGVLPWSGGVLVTAAPDILFLRDTDGDGRADERRVVLTGFGEGNQQLRVNGLTWGLDNWVYAANGRSDGAVRRPGDDPAKAVAIRRRDLRFRPDTGDIEAVSGFSQFGLPRDDWGRRFPSWNTVPFRHAVLEDRDLARNPYLAESSAVAAILDPADDGRIHAISPPQTTFNREPTNYFNASCGPTIDRGDALGPSYRGDAFVCESLTNLVHRRTLEPRGSTFLARRAEPGREFLASTDPAFRPVYLATGPDGALYVVDFYREMVEHPQFVPEAIRGTVDFRRWNDRGRIWRIRPAGERPAGPAPRPGSASTEELVATLGHPNGWRRDTAQRLLVERRDRSAVPRLVELAGTSTEPLARLHALWTLDGLGALADELVGRALEDPNAGVRENAVRLAASRPALADALLARADDADPRVRLHAAVALGDLDDPRVPATLAQVAARDVGDEWTRLAVLSGLRETSWPFLRALLDEQPGWLAEATPDQARLLEQVAAVIGARGQSEDLWALSALMAPGPAGTPDAGRIALLAGLADGLAHAGRSLRDLLAVDPPAGLPALLDRARKVATSAAAVPEARARAVAVLARSTPEAAGWLPDLLKPDQPEAVRSAAARAVGDLGSPELAGTVLESWPGLATGTRREVLAALTRSAPLAARLVDAIEDDTLALAELSATDREALRLNPDAQLRGRVEALLARSAPADRSEVLRRAESALGLGGDPGRGAELFARNCRACHRRQGEGHRVGPDLSGVTGRPASALLRDIVDPSGEVAPDYVSFLAVTRGGRVVSGLLAEETGTSLKFRGADGVEEVILRPELEVLRPAGRSLMPEGFDQVLGAQGLADVIAYLRQP